MQHFNMTQAAGNRYNFPMKLGDFTARLTADILYPLLGAVNTMPGLPIRPVYYEIDVDLETGKVVGLS